MSPINKNWRIEAAVPHEIEKRGYMDIKKGGRIFCQFLEDKDGGIAPRFMTSILQPLQGTLDFKFDHEHSSKGATSLCQTSCRSVTIFRVSSIVLKLKASRT